MVLTSKIAGAFNKVRSKFAITDAAEFLAIDEDEDRYLIIATLNESFHFEYDEYRGKFKLEVAINDEGTTSDFQSASHVRIGDDVYVISRGDTLPPKGIDFTWKFYC